MCVLFLISHQTKVSGLYLDLAKCFTLKTLLALDKSFKSSGFQQPYLLNKEAGLRVGGLKDKA